MATMAELNALMPNCTGGLAQYTLAGLGPVPTMVLMVGGYLVSNILSGGVEASIFAYAMGEVLGLPIPNFFWTVLASAIILIANLRGVDMFAKVQDLVSYLLLGSMLVMGIIGMFRLGTGQVVDQPAVLNSDPATIVSMTAVAFWLFIGAEYAIPISKDVKNANRNVPLGMFIGLAPICVVQSVMVLGFRNYTPWADPAASPAPHLLYGDALLGKAGRDLDGLRCCSGRHFHPEFGCTGTFRHPFRYGKDEYDASVFHKAEQAPCSLYRYVVHHGDHCHLRLDFQ